VSNFEFIPEIGMISFSIDKPQYVILYIPKEFVASKMLVTINGQIPGQLESKNNVLDEDIVMIKFVPDEPGLVLITPFS
jgi:hypothetical protein